MVNAVFSSSLLFNLFFLYFYDTAILNGVFVLRLVADDDGATVIHTLHDRTGRINGKMENQLQSGVQKQHNNKQPKRPPAKKENANSLVVARQQL